jgi:ferredoxin-NADP reductase
VVVSEVMAETSVARTLTLEVPGWPGHVAGQHLDVRLTAEDGYSVRRSYSIASAVEGARVQITVERVRNGEVSPYLVDIAEPGDAMEVRGPVGGYFTWQPTTPAPVLLIAGGSGIVPLMAMLRARAAAHSAVPFRLLYSVRDPDQVIYREELVRRARDDRGVDIGYVYTRRVPPGTTRPPGRLDGETLAALGLPPEFEPAVYVCGPTGFVEAVSTLLVEQGHRPANVRTERFGPTGGETDDRDPR